MSSTPSDPPWSEIDDWFARALELPGEERPAFLAGCADLTVRARVEGLLRAAEASGDILALADTPAGWSRDALVRSHAIRDLFAPGSEVLNRYRLIEEIGAGGMGVVFRGRDLKLEREVAIKVVSDPVVHRERLLREARAAAALNHPHLVGVYDVGEIENTPFLVMELVDGPTLEQAPPASPEEIVEIAHQICAALDHLHGRGIVHRDLKPSNVLRAADPGQTRVKLADLGLARSRREASLTVAGILGTPAYMAPEQARGEEADARTDLYSLGVMLYRWAAGRLPFTADDPMLLVSQHIHAPVTPLRDLRVALDPGIEDVILRLLAKDPDDRFASAAQVSRSLRTRAGGAADGPPAAPGDIGSAVERGRRAMQEGDWSRAFALLERATRDEEGEAGDLAALATAAMWAGRHDQVVPALERAAAAYTRSGDARGAAAMACELANVHFDARQLALAESWRRHAEKLLAGLPEGKEHARAAWLRARARSAAADDAGARREAEAAIDAARRTGDRDIEALALMQRGHLALKGQRFAEGVPLLEEAGAMAMTGELGAAAAGTVLCGLIFAWRALGDWGRAAEWTQAQSRWCEREKVAVFPGLCRVHRGELIRLRGDLEGAERSLRQGAEELVDVDSWVAAIGYRELGEVRLRRGDLAGAEEALRRALELGSDAQPGLARLLLLEGGAAQAVRDLRSALSATKDNLLEAENRAHLLPVLVTSALEAGERQDAEKALEELERLAESTGTGAHRAAAIEARGELLLADGRAAAAAERFVEASRLWCGLDAPYEAAEVKTKLAEALRRDGDPRGARLQMSAALAVFERLGARLQAARVRQRIEDLAGAAGAAPTSGEGASAFVEVLEAGRLRDVLGKEPWEEFHGWLSRRLSQCCVAHGGSPVSGQESAEAFGASFATAGEALRCAVEVQRVLRDHRARHGFAPPVRAAVVAGSGRPALLRARHLASGAAAGEILASRDIVGHAPSGWDAIDGAPDAVRVLWNTASTA